MSNNTRKSLRLAASLTALATAATIAAPAIAGEVVGSVTDASQTVALRSAEVTIVELGRTVASFNGKLAVKVAPVSLW